MAEQDNIQKLITEHQRRLQKLRERQAKQGLSTPPEVLTEIEDEDIEVGIKQFTSRQVEQAEVRQALANRIA